MALGLESRANGGVMATAEQDVVGGGGIVDVFVKPWGKEARLQATGSVR